MSGSSSDAREPQAATEAHTARTTGITRAKRASIREVSSRTLVRATKLGRPRATRQTMRGKPTAKPIEYLALISLRG